MKFVSYQIYAPNFNIIKWRLFLCSKFNGRLFHNNIIAKCFKVAVWYFFFMLDAMLFDNKVKNNQILKITCIFFYFPSYNHLKLYMNDLSKLRDFMTINILVRYAFYLRFSYTIFTYKNNLSKYCTFKYSISISNSP